MYPEVHDLKNNDSMHKMRVNMRTWDAPPCDPRCILKWPLPRVQTRVKKRPIRIKFSLATILSKSQRFLFPPENLLPSSKFLLGSLASDSLMGFRLWGRVKLKLNLFLFQRSLLHYWGENCWSNVGRSKAERFLLPLRNKKIIE